MRILILLCFFLVILQTYGKEEQQLAFTQQTEADAVVDFWHWDSLSLRKPKIKRDLNKGSLIQAFDGVKKKNLVVIILDKRVAPNGKKVSLDALVKDFHKFGFTRVVVQLSSGRSHPTGLPILKDSTKE